MASKPMRSIKQILVFKRCSRAGSLNPYYACNTSHRNVTTMSSSKA